MFVLVPHHLSLLLAHFVILLFFRSLLSFTILPSLSTGHFLGNHSIIDILQKDGYEINHVKPNQRLPQLVLFGFVKSLFKLSAFFKTEKYWTYWDHRILAALDSVTLCNVFSKLSCNAQPSFTIAQCNRRYLAYISILGSVVRSGVYVIAQCITASEKIVLQFFRHFLQ